jgi:hypothetical protein
MSPRVVHAARDWFHAHRLGPTSRNIVGAFAAGAAFSGVIAVSWIASWSAMEAPPPAQTARVEATSAQSATKTGAPPPAAAVAASAATPKPSLAQARAAPESKQSAGQVPCERQTWPYIEQRCLETAGAAPSTPQQHVRVIAPEKRKATPRRAPVRGIEPVAEQKSTLATPVPAAAPLEPEAAAAIAAVPLPPEKPRQVEAVASASENVTASANNATKSSADEPAAAKRQTRRWRSGDTAKRRQRHGGERSAQVRQHGRDVTVVRTYELADGRRVTVTRTYRAGQRPALYGQDVPTYRYRRPFPRAFSAVPYRYGDELD